MKTFLYILLIGSVMCGRTLTKNVRPLLISTTSEMDEEEEVFYTMPPVKNLSKFSGKISSFKIELNLIFINLFN